MCLETLPGRSHSVLTVLIRPLLKRPADVLQAGSSALSDVTVCQAGQTIAAMDWSCFFFFLTTLTVFLSV